MSKELSRRVSKGNRLRATANITAGAAAAALLITACSTPKNHHNSAPTPSPESSTPTAADLVNNGERTYSQQTVSQVYALIETAINKKYTNPKTPVETPTSTALTSPNPGKHTTLTASYDRINHKIDFTATYGDALFAAGLLVTRQQDIDTLALTKSAADSGLSTVLRANDGLLVETASYINGPSETDVMHMVETGTDKDLHFIKKRPNQPTTDQTVVAGIVAPNPNTIAISGSTPGSDGGLGFLPAIQEVYNDVAGELNRHIS